MLLQQKPNLGERLNDFEVGFLYLVISMHAVRKKDESIRSVIVETQVAELAWTSSLLSLLFQEEKYNGSHVEKECLTCSVGQVVEIGDRTII